MCLCVAWVVIPGCAHESHDDADTDDVSADETSEAIAGIGSETDSARAKKNVAGTDAEVALDAYLDAAEDLNRMYSQVSDAFSAKQMTPGIRDNVQKLVGLRGIFAGHDADDKTAAMQKYAARWAALQEKFAREIARIERNPEVVGMMGQYLATPTLE